MIVEKIKNPARKEKYPKEILRDESKLNEMWNEVLLKVQLIKNLVDQSLEAFDVACQNKRAKVAGFLFENASIFVFRTMSIASFILRFLLLCLFRLLLIFA